MAETSVLNVVIALEKNAIYSVTKPMLPQYLVLIFYFISQETGFFSFLIIFLIMIFGIVFVFIPVIYRVHGSISCRFLSILGKKKTAAPIIHFEVTVCS